MKDERGYGGGENEPEREAAAEKGAAATENSKKGQKKN